MIRVEKVTNAKNEVKKEKEEEALEVRKFIQERQKEGKNGKGKCK